MAILQKSAETEPGTTETIHFIYIILEQENLCDCDSDSNVISAIM